jgi:hypothetical protein
MYAERHEVSITVDASGDGTGYTPHVTGRIQSIRYVKDDFADTVDFTITLEATGETVWTEENVTASKTVAPRQATHSTAGVAAAYASGGTAVNDYVVAANDRVKIVIANGGNATSGTFHVIVG